MICSQVFISKGFLYSIGREEYITIPSSNITIAPKISEIFSKYYSVFSYNPNLWIKGGGARSSLMKYVCDEKNKMFSGNINYNIPTVLDIDLVLINGNYDQYEMILEEMKQDVSKKDFEMSSSFDNYFNSRDFSINKVILRPDMLVTTRDAVRDLSREYIAPTNYEYNTEYRDISPKMCLRSILFSIRNNMGISPIAYSSLHKATYFLLALFMFKAYESGIEDEFYKAIVDYINAPQFDYPFEALKYFVNKSNFVLTEEQQRFVQKEEVKHRQEKFYDKYEDLDQII